MGVNRRLRLRLGVPQRGRLGLGIDDRCQRADPGGVLLLLGRQSLRLARVKGTRLALRSEQNATGALDLPARTKLLSPPAAVPGSSTSSTEAPPCCRTTIVADM